MSKEQIEEIRWVDKAKDFIDLVDGKIQDLSSSEIIENLEKQIKEQQSNVMNLLKEDDIEEKQKIVTKEGTDDDIADTFKTGYKILAGIGTCTIILISTGLILFKIKKR